MIFWKKMMKIITIWEKIYQVKRTFFNMLIPMSSQKYTAQPKEQKPVKVDDFNEIEEKQVKERAEKRKQKRREVAESNKLLKKRENKRNLRRKKINAETFEWTK